MEFVKSIEGKWVGNGVGVYPPTIPEFRYKETLTITALPKPGVWRIDSSTAHASTGKPMHSETGFLRTSQEGGIELVLSHPFGVCEIAEGLVLSANRVVLNASSEGLTRTRTAKTPHTTMTKRTYEVSQDGMNLTFTMDMATSNHPEIQNHLVCHLSREM